MLTFAVYNGFTSETQDFRLNIKKDLVLFKGWRVVIPLLISFALAFVMPPAAIAFFIFCFIAELAMSMYNRLPADQKPALGGVVLSVVTAAVWCLVGVFAVRFLPANFYFILVGLAVLGLTGLPGMQVCIVMLSAALGMLFGISYYCS